MAVGHALRGIPEDKKNKKQTKKTAGGLQTSRFTASRPPGLWTRRLLGAGQKSCVCWNPPSADVPHSRDRRLFHHSGKTKRGLWAAGTASFLAFPLTKSDAVGLSKGLVGPSGGRDAPMCLGCRPSPALG